MNYSPNYSMPEPGYGDLADIDAVNDAIEMIDHLTHGNRTMFAGGWEAEETYSKGKYVVKTNPTNLEADFYRCKEDNTTGTWDASKWEHKTIGEVLEELAQGAVAQELDDLSDVEITSPSEGQILRRNANGDWVNTDMPDASVTKTAEGNPVEFTDGADAPLVKCVSAITGSQDLHGYDKPWVGGAGKNKLPKGISGTSGTIEYTVNDDGSVLVTGTENSSTAFWGVQFSLPAGSYILSGCPTGGGNSSYLIDIRNAVGGGGIPGIAGDIGSGSSFTLSEPLTAYVNIRIASGYSIPSGGLLFKPMIRLATESDSTFTPYSNICPITAYDESTISVGGSVNLVLGVISECNIGPTGALQYNSEFDMYYARVRRGVTYSANVTVTGGFFTTYPEIGSVSYNSERVVNLQSPFVSPIDGFICFRTSAGVTNGMLVEGETMPSYVAPNITEHTANFSSSIYQGNADFIGGGSPKVTGNWIVKELNGSEGFTLMPAAGDNPRRFMKSVSDLGWPTVDATPGAIFISDKFVAAKAAPSNPFGTFRLSTYLVFPDAGEVFSDATEFNQWLADNHPQIAYKLQTPATETITPTNLPIKSLFGYNHIESSTGDMEVEYIAKAFSPITELVDSQISALQKMMELMLTSARETAMTASANYTTGTLIVACGALYKATTAISSGASLVVGTNITPTTIAAELAALA